MKVRITVLIISSGTGYSFVEQTCNPTDDEQEIIAAAKTILHKGDEIVAAKWETRHGFLRLYVHATGQVLANQKEIAAQFKQYFRLPIA